MYQVKQIFEILEDEEGEKGRISLYFVQKGDTALLTSNSERDVYGRKVSLQTCNKFLGRSSTSLGTLCACCKTFSKYFANIKVTREIILATAKTLGIKKVIVTDKFSADGDCRVKKINLPFEFVELPKDEAIEIDEPFANNILQERVLYLEQNEYALEYSEQKVIYSSSLR